MATDVDPNLLLPSQEPPPPEVRRLPLLPSRQVMLVRLDTMPGWARFIARRPLVILAVIFLAAVAATAAFPSMFWPKDPMALDFTAIMAPPAPAHPMGTDQYGRQVLAELIYGGREAMSIGIFSVLGAGMVGAFIGLIAGYWGGLIDTLLMRLIDVLMVFPGILLALLVTAALGSSLQDTIIAVAVASIPSYARITRGQVLSIKSRLYIDAAVTSGLRPTRILRRHILPNAVAPLVVLATIGVGTAIVVGSSLSFLGLGPSSGVPGWGRLLAQGEAYIGTAWWISTFPGLLITAVVIAVNILGDWLRDLLDVRSQ